jgi:hypothetical protein
MAVVLCGAYARFLRWPLFNPSHNCPVLCSGRLFPVRSTLFFSYSGVCAGVRSLGSSSAPAFHLRVRDATSSSRNGQWDNLVTLVVIYPSRFNDWGWSAGLGLDSTGPRYMTWRVHECDHPRVDVSPNDSPIEHAFRRPPKRRTMKRCSISDYCDGAVQS